MLSNNKLVHNRNVTFIDSDYTHLSQGEIRQELAARVPMPGVSGNDCPQLSADSLGSPAECLDPQELNKGWLKDVSIEQCDLFDLYKRSEISPEQEYFEGTPGKGDWLTHGDAQAVKWQLARKW